MHESEAENPHVQRHRASALGDQSLTWAHETAYMARSTSFHRRTPGDDGRSSSPCSVEAENSPNSALRVSRGHARLKSIKADSSVRCSARGALSPCTTSIRNRLSSQGPLERFAAAATLFFTLQMLSGCGAELPRSEEQIAGHKSWSAAPAADLRAKHAVSWPYPSVGSKVHLREVRLLPCICAHARSCVPWITNGLQRCNRFRQSLVLPSRSTRPSLLNSSGNRRTHARTAQGELLIYQLPITLPCNSISDIDFLHCPFLFTRKQI